MARRDATAGRCRMLVRILQSLGVSWRPETLMRARVPLSRAAMSPSTSNCSSTRFQEVIKGAKSNCVPECKCPAFFKKAF